MDLEWAQWLAIVGATTGVCALLIQFFQYIHLKPKLRVDIKPECTILRDEFKVQDPNTENTVSYKPATHIVITNLGQMSTVILGLEFYAQRKRKSGRFLPFLQKVEYTISHDAFVDQTSKPPYILNSGHAWLAIANLEKFRENMKENPYVFLKIRPSHKKRSVIKRVRLAS